MSDQGRWWKLWVTAPYDPDLGSLSLENFARWCLFGVYLKVHGTDGIVRLSPPAFPVVSLLRVRTFDEVIGVLQEFPNCRVTPVTNATVTYEIEWRNWRKYQGDFSGDRVRKHRGKSAPRVTDKEEKRGEEKRGEEKKKRTTTSSSPRALPEEAEWGMSFCLILKYNKETPDNVPSVRSLSDARIKRERDFLRMFPDESWWTATFSQYHRSRFLQGISNGSEGHHSFKPDFDWLLSKGKDGIENCVKVHDGRYRDG
jgi:hypothetical protein